MDYLVMLAYYLNLSIVVDGFNMLAPQSYRNELFNSKFRELCRHYDTKDNIINAFINVILRQVTDYYLDLNDTNRNKPSNYTNIIGE